MAFLDEALGPIDGGGARQDGDLRRATSMMAQDDIVGLEVQGIAAGSMDRGDDRVMRKRGDARGSEDQGGTGRKEGSQWSRRGGGLRHSQMPGSLWQNQGDE